MTFHKFKVGQTVRFLPQEKDQYDLRGSYVITRLLPSETRDLQYRLKSDRDGHERVVLESQLVATFAASSPLASWTQRI